jgi:hypothetical protein
VPPRPIGCCADVKTQGYAARVKRRLIGVGLAGAVGAAGVVIIGLSANPDHDPAPAGPTWSKQDRLDFTVGEYRGGPVLVRERGPH